MAFSSIMTLTILLVKIIVRFVRYPDRLSILHSPLVITRSVDRGAWVDRTLAALTASVARGGPAEMRALAKRLLVACADIEAQLDAHPGDNGGSNSAVVIGAGAIPAAPQHVVAPMHPVVTAIMRPEAGKPSHERNKR